MIKQYRLSREWEEGTLLDKGFTLIELLIVIVVLGILAATVIFALGGVTGQSAQAACNSDAKSVEVAVEAYHSYPGNSTNAYPTTVAELVTGIAGSGKFLHAVPNNTHYTIGLSGDGNAPATPKDGVVYVTPNTGAAGTTGPNSTVAGIDYDGQVATPTATGCYAVT